MWREFTHESPARPRLALWTTLGIFAGTVGLAQFVVSARSPIAPLQDVSQSPAGWPFVFDLPVGYSWSPAGEAWAPRVEPNGDAGAAGFVGRGKNGQAILEIRFEVLPPETTTEAVARGLLHTDFGSGRSIRLGPIDGQMEAISTPAATGFMAAGCLPCGVGIGLTYFTTPPGEHAEQEFKALCRSITFQDWWMEP